MVRALADVLRVADSTIATEVRSLVGGSSARPADVYTQAAVPGRDAALDVTISAGAGADYCATAYRRKMRRYRQLLELLA